MKKSIVAVCFCFLAAYAAYAEVGDRHVEQAGGYSFQAPRGWQIRELPGMKYQIAFGPAENNFSPNINIVDEAYNGSLKTYVDANAQTLERLFVQFKLVKRHPFETTSGLRGEKAITTSVHQNNALRQTFYFLPGRKGSYFVVTCSTLAADGESFDPVFEESVKTFELIK